MTLDNLLLLAFLNKWTPLVKLLSSNDVRIIKSFNDKTYLAIPTQVILNMSPNFFVDMDNTTVVYMHEEINNISYFSIYHK